MAFQYCNRLVSIEMHDGVEIIENSAFYECQSLRRINLSGVRVIEEWAFADCIALEEVEFGDKLETIGYFAFNSCSALRNNIKLPTVRVIGNYAFAHCQQLTEVELSEDLETVGVEALAYCPSLRRISIPLKDEEMIEDDEEMIEDNAFMKCKILSQVDLVGGIHKTISSLVLERWKHEMKDEIDRINRDLPNTDPEDKTDVIRRWMDRVIRRIEHYKSEHYVLLKEFTTLLELALWKAKIDESQDERSLGSDQPAKKPKMDMKAVRQEARVTSGANIVIKNVLPFLKLE
jgi:hypothetical protein